MEHLTPPQVLEDWRWGYPKLYLGWADEPLLVHPTVRTCAAFLGRQIDGNPEIVATAFFLWCQDGGLSFPYLVTAGHIIEHSADPDYSDDGMIYLYLNSKSGTRFQPIRTEISHWKFHPTDAAIDVAVLPFKILPDLDHTVLDPEPHQDVRDNPQRWRLDVGTDIFITGLFMRHAGRERNIPIVRTGNIAAMPEEKIDIAQPGEGERLIRAYLVETHSVGGLSGSPVFANPTNLARIEAKIALQSMHIWIGLVSAHWQYDQDKNEAEQLNSGIAIVTPKESVLEVFQNPELIKMREAEKKRRAKTTAPKFDDAKPKRKNRDVLVPPISREKFFDALEKATKRDK